MRKFAITAALSASALVAVAVLLVGGAPRFSGAADHGDAPFVQADPRIDINDIYVFHPGSPQDLSTTVLVMTVNPFAGAPSPTTLRPGVAYEILIDNTGDAVEDIVYRLNASGAGGAGAQNVNLHKATGGGGGESIARGQTESTIPVEGGGSLFVGLRDDPFFFDLLAFLPPSPLDFCPPSGNPNTKSGIDFFAGLNVTAIVLEVPTADLVSSPDIGVWGRTVVSGKQLERMGRPVINTVLIPSGSKNDFNATEPADDMAIWTDTVEASLSSLGGDPGLAAILLPDVLATDISIATGFLNGRNLADDVIDASLGLVSGGAITSDCVGANDVSFLSTFPYLADPH